MISFSLIKHYTYQLMSLVDYIDPNQLLSESDSLAATLCHFRLVHVCVFPSASARCNRAEVICLTKWKISQNLSNHMD